MLELNKIYNIDCLEGMKMLSNGSIDLIIADPPYNIGGNKRSKIKHINGKHYTRKEKWDMFTIGEYKEFIFNWINESKRVLKENGNILVFGNKDNIYEIGVTLKELDFKINNHIVWFKRNSPPNVTCRLLTHSCEHIIWAVNGESYWTFNYQIAKKLNGDKQQRDLYDIPMTPENEKKFGRHPTQKPTELIKRLVLTFSNQDDLILDPFMGSGTTAVVCKKLNRNFIGFEINPEYCKIAEERLKMS